MALYAQTKMRNITQSMTQISNQNHFLFQSNEAITHIAYVFRCRVMICDANKLQMIDKIDGLKTAVVA